MQNVVIYQNLPVKGLIFLRSPPLLGFCLGWSSNFVGSVSGQIQNVKLLAEFGLQQAGLWIRTELMQSGSASSIFLFVMRI
jgi:hypothetical protein